MASDMHAFIYSPTEFLPSTYCVSGAVYVWGRKNGAEEASFSCLHFDGEGGETANE